MFKKLFVLPLVLLLLCGCSNEKTVTPILDNISFTTQIEYKDNDFVANADLYQNTLNLFVTAPAEIKGLSFKVSKDAITAEFKGVTYTSEINSMPQSAIVQILYDVLTHISSLQNTVIYDEENCIIKNKINGYEYKFTFSPSGLPISLKIENLDLEIKFKNVTVK